MKYKKSGDKVKKLKDKKQDNNFKPRRKNQQQVIIYNPHHSVVAEDIVGFY